MKKEKEEIKEPYQPENTPQPPQRIDPDVGQKRENPVEGKGRTSEPGNKAEHKSERSHLLDEDSEIDDETTI